MPAWHRAGSEGVMITDCATCTRERDQYTRQLLGCGWEPAPAPQLRPFVRAPIPEGAERPPLPDDHPIDRPPPPWPTVCPGYSTSLPETIEIARAWNHWTKGSLRDFCGSRPAVAIVEGVELFDAWVNDLKTKLVTPRSKGGLADDR